MPADVGALFLAAEIVHTAQAFFKNLGSHDCRSHRQDTTLIKPFHRLGKQPEIDFGRATHDTSPEHRMIGDDVVPDPRMNRHWHVALEGGCEDGRLFPWMRTGKKAVGHLELFHDLQAIDLRSRLGMARVGEQRCFQGCLIGKGAAILRNKFTERHPIAQSVQSSRKQGQHDGFSGFIPGAEGSRFHIVPHRFGGASQVGIFKVMNGAGSIGGKMGDPITFHHPVQDLCRTVPQQMRSVNEHDRSTLFPGMQQGACRVADAFPLEGVQVGGREIGIQQDLFHPGQTPTFFKRENFQFGPIKWMGWGRGHNGIRMQEHRSVEAAGRPHPGNRR